MRMRQNHRGRSKKKGNKSEYIFSRLSNYLEQWRYEPMLVGPLPIQHPELLSTLVVLQLLQSQTLLTPSSATEAIQDDTLSASVTTSTTIDFPGLTTTHYVMPDLQE
ncbi:hypothetical protein HAX54_049931 [Datura stramonium]|uniref:Uncharacterized protein n=1 Tax=Datura stramonium TaxID=4076 RepID=A0ABS8SVZ6_DATST|nr:hypothetical protein [Datura stramonium]